MSFPDPDINSGRVMQPGAAFVRTAPVKVDEAAAVFDVAVADEVTEVDVAVVEKPVRRRRKAAPPVDVAEPVEDAAESVPE